MNTLATAITKKIQMMDAELEQLQAERDARRLQGKLRAASQRDWFVQQAAQSNIDLSAEDIHVDVIRSDDDATEVRCCMSIPNEWGKSAEVGWDARWTKGQGWGRPQFSSGLHYFRTFMEAAVYAATGRRRGHPEGSRS